MMRQLSPEEEERKKAVFDGMSEKRQQHILKKEGYDNWDPFQEPQEPIDMRREKSKRTAIELTKEFLVNWNEHGDHEYSNVFGQGVWEMCLGIINNDEQYKGMYEFSCWYRDYLKKQGLE
jgi:hypothetical protein